MGPRARQWLPLVASGLVVLAPGFASPQVPAGAEFRVNTYTADAEFAPAVARESDGDFVVVWVGGGHDGDQYGIFGQRYDASGARRGAEFQVNTYTTGSQFLVSVATDDKGRFVVVWSTFNATPDGSGRSVHGQRFAADGSRLGGEFIVNTYTTGNQSWARVSANRAGDFVVVWASPQLAANHTEIVGQRFDRTGQRIGGEFLVNQATAGHQDIPEVALTDAGAFAVVWGGPDGSSYGIWARTYSADGTPLGPEFRVHGYTTDLQTFPSLATVRGRGATVPPVFQVAWQSYGQDGSDDGVFTRSFDFNGLPLSPEILVNSYTTSGQRRPAVSLDDGSNAVVSWTSAAPQDGSGSSLMARRYRSGAPNSPEFGVNTYTTGLQDTGDVGSDGVGNFVVSWVSFAQDGSAAGVFAQRFGGLHPRGLAVDAVGNHVLEPGEAAAVAPSWQNLTGAAQTFAGTLTAPPDPNCIHSVVDGVGSYGTVPDGVTAVCTDCYVVSATASTPRCRPHWDMRTIETLTPAAQGQTKEWILHVGGSFTDVPTNNVFYRFIETAFHNGVTGGCGTGLFCPSGFLNREQIPVFILVGKEGTGYQPPACVPPNMFDDVPETSPFCRWIEELARRGVVAGCSTNPPLYCPHGVFTREQLAVFILRLLDPGLDPPPCVPPNMFDDVPETSPFCRWIEELARRGSAGCSTNPPLYCPHDPVTREQITVFISVMFGLTLYGP